MEFEIRRHEPPGLVVLFYGKDHATMVEVRKAAELLFSGTEAEFEEAVRAKQMELLAGRVRDAHVHPYEDDGEID